MANNRNGTEDQVIQKEAEAFNLRVQGWSQLRIAQHLGMTQQGVSKALKRVTKRFSQHFLKDIRQIKFEQVLQLETLAEEAIFAWHKSKADSCGDPRFLSEFRKAKEEIRHILGADQPIVELEESKPITKIEIKVIDPNGYLDSDSDTRTH